MKQKYEKLKRFLANLGSAAVAFSGGVDSGLLLKVAFDVLGPKAAAVTADAAIFARRDFKAGKDIAKEIGVRRIVVNLSPLENKRFRRNGKDKCYWCKKELFLKIGEAALAHNLKYILDGTNCDDTADVRAGLQANKELGVVSPFYECGFRKKEIAALAQNLGLSFWSRPSGTCLSSRIPAGDEITLAKLAAVEKAEDILIRHFGRDVLLRARAHGDLLRVELEKREWTKLGKSDINRIITKIKKAGYKYITVDWEGYVPAGMRDRM